MNNSLVSSRALSLSHRCDHRGCDGSGRLTGAVEVLPALVVGLSLCAAPSVAWSFVPFVHAPANSFPASEKRSVPLMTAIFFFLNMKTKKRAAPFNNEVVP